MSPFVLPKLPSRVYVRFGEAISLEGLNRRDKVACQETYERVKVCKPIASWSLPWCGNDAASRLPPRHAAYSASRQ